MPADEVMCNTIGCVYVRVNVPHKEGIGMLGVHIHPDPDSEVTGEAVATLLEDAAKDLVEEIPTHF